MGTSPLLPPRSWILNSGTQVIMLAWQVMSPTLIVIFIIQEHQISAVLSQLVTSVLGKEWTGSYYRVMGPLVLGGLLREVRVERSRWACSHTGEREYYHRLGIFCIQVVARAVPRNLHSQRALQDGKDHTQAQLGQVYTVFPLLLAVNRKLSRHCSRNPIYRKGMF